MRDFLDTMMWFTLYSLPSFLIQLIICLKIKNRYIRLAPAAVSVLGILLGIDAYFNFTGLHHGWHELGAAFILIYVGIYTMGIAFGRLAAFIIKRKKK